MPLYVFKNEQTGEQCDMHFAVDEAPGIGDCVTVDGARYIRLPSLPQISADVKNVVHNYPYESHSLEEGWSKKGPTGGQVVYSRRHEREIMERSKDNGAPYVRI